MEGKELKEFLTGIFATWFAERRGHSKPNAKDKKDAAAVAASSVDLFQYRIQFGK